MRRARRRGVALGRARPRRTAASRRCSRRFALVAGGFAWLEQGGDTARDLTLVATLGGIAAAGRVLFAPIPSVQPVTVIVAAAGVALGPRRGFAVGALAAIASNMFLGQGAHTPWQMLAWGGCGVLAGVFGFAPAPEDSVRGLLRGARDGVRDADGSLALVRLLPAHVGGARHRARGRDRVQHRARAREPRARPRRRARVAACARAARAQPRTRRSCGHEPADGACARLFATMAVAAAALAPGGERSDRPRRFRGVPRRPAERERRLRRAGARARRGADAWAALGLVAADGSPAARARALDFLRAHGDDASTDADLALRVVALAALGEHGRRDASWRGSAATGRTSSSTPRCGPCSPCAPSGEQPPQPLVQAILSAQAKGGGFPWSSRRAARLERHGGGDPGSPRGRRRAAPRSGAPWRRCARSRTGTAASR